MPRPVHADAEATKQRILEAGAILFSERGRKGASIREIAKGAGVSLGMVHHYFGSKEALHDACVEAMYARMSELRSALGSALSRSPDHTTLDNIVRTCFRFARAHQREIRLVMRTVVDTRSVGEKRRTEIVLPFMEEASSLFASVLGGPKERFRLPIQSMIFLTARYALGDEEELALSCGVESSEVAAHIEDHLVETASALFGLKPDPVEAP